MTTTKLSAILLILLFPGIITAKPVNEQASKLQDASIDSKEAASPAAISNNSGNIDGEKMSMKPGSTMKSLLQRLYHDDKDEDKSKSTEAKDSVSLPNSQPSIPIKHIQASKETLEGGSVDAKEQDLPSAGRAAAAAPGVGGAQVLVGSSPKMSGDYGHLNTMGDPKELFGKDRGMMYSMADPMMGLGGYGGYGDLSKYAGGLGGYGGYGDFNKYAGGFGGLGLGGLSDYGMLGAYGGLGYDGFSGYGGFGLYGPSPHEYQLKSMMASGLPSLTAQMMMPSPLFQAYGYYNHHTPKVFHQKHYKDGDDDGKDDDKGDDKDDEVDDKLHDQIEELHKQMYPVGTLFPGSANTVRFLAKLYNIPILPIH
ncbi:hypothetical protein H4219_005443 [Mycoemilia scoparia]|uniref:Uncharacterized protein n=1 Tax=Mycoemilia scoparia TaxID=417184 RepID=A0A9W7ZP25_9FUNG|nr:hypothetical protein H4219_005443 [Mycoemilia scoparia]